MMRYEALLERDDMTMHSAVVTQQQYDSETVTLLFDSGFGPHEYVDLGLPSGLLWATCNVGATSPEEYGDYFAWGETLPKDTYNWSTYQYCNGSHITLTKYCNDSNYGYNGFTDNLTTLEPSDDAATANWGSGWRTPTREQWQELLINTTNTWTTRNGVNGRLFTASNGNSLFLPAAGYRYNSSLYNAGTDGNYWSSLLFADNPGGVWSLYFTSGNANVGGYYSRYCGLSVRPVRVGSQSTFFIINATANSAEGGEVSGGGTYQEGTECTLTAMPNAGYTFTNWTENGEVVSTNATYTFTVNADRNLVANFTYHSGVHFYVDLGLPSGTLWATCNVGADTPEEYGDYFAWGETSTKSTYSWSTYQYCNGSLNTLTKYCPNPDYGYNGFIDYSTFLLPEDDVATANWGNGWRIPTQWEWQELYQNTTHVWTTQNGVNGLLFFANGNSLFLPAAGFILYNLPVYVGDHCYYWSRELYYRNPNSAWGFYFSLDEFVPYTDIDDRCSGRSIRPVRSGSGSTSFIINATAYPFEGGEVIGGGTYQEGTGCTLTATPNEGYTFTNWTENGEVVSANATYTFVVNADRTLVANFAGGDHAYVDLGLPSGLLWATCNVGATSPEEYGDYFAWGETQPKDTYNWATYQYCNGSSNTLTKYCNDSGFGSYGYNGFTDNLTTLLPEDDAATANWGDGWRMPTNVEFGELYNNTTVTWTTQNGVNGRLFTAANGNSLFLPASSLGYPGSLGSYWSSRLDTGFPDHAWFLYFGSGEYDVYSCDRAAGLSVRPVHVGSQNTSFIINATANPAEGGEVSGGGTYQVGAECILTATANEGYTFTYWAENGVIISTDTTYVFTVSSGRILVANFAYNCGGGDHAYVDLGLPSGLMWATCNIGANTPEGYGDYFAWDETRPKDSYNWSTYQYCNGSYNTLTKYCNNSSYGYNGFTDNLNTLLPEDDAATANWGDGWRMPTQEEFQELLDNTTITWTIQNGVNGRLFTASNGNSLFLPAAGCRVNSGFSNIGSHGGYWSSSLSGTPVYAGDLNFTSGGANVGSYYRYGGFSVRPVRVGSQNTSFIINATANPTEAGEVSGGGTYQVGAECILTATANEGYTFTYWAENGVIISTDTTYAFTVSSDRILVANFAYNGSGNAPTGAINGKFSINEAGDQVYFSQGNLQYQASTNTWRFADNQWDWVGGTILDVHYGNISGSSNNNISSTCDGWIDLFGWGTSGNDHGAVCYQPWSMYTNQDAYYAYGVWNANLYDQTGQADWGFNAISNGENTANQWRTLTRLEWAFIFNTRSTTSGIRYAKANVNGVNGVILLPDDWNTNIYSLSNINSNGASFSSNSITATQWLALENAGAVFLPAAGYREGTSFTGTNGGRYWSASYSSGSNAYEVRFYDAYLNPQNGYGHRCYGASVRLVVPIGN